MMKFIGNLGAYFEKEPNVKNSSSGKCYFEYIIQNFFLDFFLFGVRRYRFAETASTRRVFSVLSNTLFYQYRKLSFIS